jgi:hypothetical protein
MVPRKAFGIGKGSIYLENVSVTTSMKRLPLVDLGYGPIRLSPTVSPGFWRRLAWGGSRAFGCPPFTVAQVVQTCTCVKRSLGQKNSSRTALVVSAVPKVAC